MACCLLWCAIYFTVQLVTEPLDLQMRLALCIISNLWLKRIVPCWLETHRSMSHAIKAAEREWTLDVTQGHWGYLFSLSSAKKPFDDSNYSRSPNRINMRVIAARLQDTLWRPFMSRHRVNTSQILSLMIINIQEGGSPCLLLASLCPLVLLSFRSKARTWRRSSSGWLRSPITWTR